MPGVADMKGRRWYSSFYWRIGVSFVLFLIAVLVAQSIMFSYMMARSAQGAFVPPNTIAAAVATEVGALVARDPGASVDAVLSRYRDRFSGIYVVMKDGRVIGSTARPLPDDLRLDAEAVLTGTARRAETPSQTTGPVVTAPIQVANELRGLVVMPPPEGGMLRDVARLLSLPGTLVLIVATILVAVVIFAPARRRLLALQAAAERLGRGDLSSRAPVRGHDEIARVGRAFNDMASALAASTNALQASNRLRRQMLADISHELKTPLTAMRGYLETLHMRKDIDRATLDRYLDTVVGEMGRLERIVKDLVDLARYENGAGTLSVRVFATERVFQGVLRRHEREAQVRRVRLRTNVEPLADQMLGDPDRIEQVLQNLVANALRHSSEGSDIELNATASSDGWRISVVDSGTGIAPEHLAHVFDRFYKVDAARAAAGGDGSGLGLSIAKAIVERHGGTIGVTSRPGRTEFSIVLPHEAAARAEQASHSTSANL
jgi:signal transduction histidine kinase